MIQILWSERAYARRQAIEDYILYSFGHVALDKYVAELGYASFGNTFNFGFGKLMIR